MMALLEWPTSVGSLIITSASLTRGQPPKQPRTHFALGRFTYCFKIWALRPGCTSRVGPERHRETLRPSGPVVGQLPNFLGLGRSPIIRLTDVVFQIVELQLGKIGQGRRVFLKTCVRHPEQLPVTLPDSHQCAEAPVEYFVRSALTVAREERKKIHAVEIDMTELDAGRCERGRKDVELDHWLGIDRAWGETAFPFHNKRNANGAFIGDRKSVVEGK